MISKKPWRSLNKNKSMEKSKSSHLIRSTTISKHMIPSLVMKQMSIQRHPMTMIMICILEKARLKTERKEVSLMMLKDQLKSIKNH